MRQIGQLDITADRIGHEIDVMAELAERFDAVVLAEGRAARLEERLRREHQDAHESLYLTEQWQLGYNSDLSHNRETPLLLKVSCVSA